MSNNVEQKLARLFIQKVQNHLCEGSCKDIDETNRRHIPASSRNCASHEHLRANGLFIEAMNELNILGTWLWEKAWLKAIELGFSSNYTQERAQYIVTVTVSIPVAKANDSEAAKVAALETLKTQLPEFITVVSGSEHAVNADQPPEAQTKTDEDKLSLALELFKQKLPMTRVSSVYEQFLTDRLDLVSICAKQADIDGECRDLELFQTFVRKCAEHAGLPELVEDEPEYIKEAASEAVREAQEALYGSSYSHV